jgi:hypothetical protein
LRAPISPRTGCRRRRSSTASPPPSFQDTPTSLLCGMSRGDSQPNDGIVSTPGNGARSGLPEPVCGQRDETSLSWASSASVQATT